MKYLLLMVSFLGASFSLYSMQTETGLKCSAHDLEENSLTSYKVFYGPRNQLHITDISPDDFIAAAVAHEKSHATIGLMRNKRDKLMQNSYKSFMGNLGLLMIGFRTSHLKAHPMEAIIAYEPNDGDEKIVKNYESFFENYKFDSFSGILCKEKSSQLIIKVKDDDVSGEFCK